MVEERTGRAVLSRSQLLSTIYSFIPDPDRVHAIEPLGDGNINATYLVTFMDRSPLVVQRLNESVFPDPIGVARNVALVTSYLSKRWSLDSGRYQFCRFPRTFEFQDGRSWFEDQSGGIWRCLSYIDNGVSYPCVVSNDQPAEAGRMLGCFHALMESFDSSVLVDPLPGFHNLKNYRGSYLEALDCHRRSENAEFHYCLEMIEDRLESLTLEERIKEDKIRRRVIHGDPKCDNFLFDRESGQALALIDLDTVSQGLLAVDIGDCLRSFCNPAGEKAGSDIVFDIHICNQLLKGYLKSFDLSRSERNLIYHGVRLLTYELGLRFFTDHLNDDRYFRITREGENLQRAGIQFKLLESIEKQRSAIEKSAGIV
ncbi:MAG: aminoglycoside phosphotransferase family protein [Desulfofustis sp.]|nr:aminoglycoside phosphotransferase family protein [Desulfofustis sp.]